VNGERAVAMHGGSLTDWRWEVISFIELIFDGEDKRFNCLGRGLLDMAGRLIEISFTILISVPFMIVVM
jgi:hypothetical protein